MWQRRVKKLHFVGIGGAGMSGIAEILAATGFVITGSDLADSETTVHLRSLGIPCAIGHDPAHVGSADVVVISSAVAGDNPEVAAAVQRGIPVIRRAEMLGELMRLKFSVGIAGTHGKTTTTSMIGHILTQAGWDPTVIVGGRLIQLDANAQLGKSQYLIAEADEYDHSFLSLHPTVAIATNLEEDHLDCYADLADLQDNFVEFFHRVPFYGTVLTNRQSPALQAISARINRRHRTFGTTPDADVVAESLAVSSRSSRFDLVCDQRRLATIDVPLPGHHNAENALAACAVALELEVPVEAIRQSLATFTGVGRRFEVKGVEGGVTVVDDYGHHPTEVRAALAAGRSWLAGKGRLLAIFQPHLYSRTQHFHHEFAAALSEADGVILAPIYAAREKPLPGVASRLIADHLTSSNLPLGCTLAPDLDDVPDLVADKVKSGDLVMTIGAGSIYRVGPQILLRLKPELVRA
ncbi:MAG: UDP-N-acetylmuramate--L-alanine ligase [candidate division Zixibacteria bacterium]|nr:UDP-N-acetylmuramate--L-alanine ligase [candidate division Zixibacteria bacterium]